MKKNTRFVGLDVHKDTISVAIAEPGRQGEVKFYGTVSNTPEAIRRLVKKIGPATNLDFCYEAGPCGYVLYWLIVGLGAVCSVVAPSLIPQRAGDRVKTDRRDAEKLARLHRSGELTPVYVPDEEHEALRDLVRARETAIEDQQRARNRLSKFLLRRGINRPKGWSAWTMKHLEWVEKQRSELKYESDRNTLTDYLYEVNHQAERIKRLDQAIHEAVANGPSRVRAVVAALAGFKGVGELTAVTLVAEIGDFSRFDKAPELMSYCGVVPSEHSSGGPGKARRGRITKAGNAHLRRVLIESAHHYSRGPRISKGLAHRQRELAPEYRDISWRAQHRLHQRYRRLIAREKPSGKVIVAVARELLGFIWDVAVRAEYAHDEKNRRGRRTAA